MLKLMNRKVYKDRDRDRSTGYPFFIEKIGRVATQIVWKSSFWRLRLAIGSFIYRSDRDFEAEDHSLSRKVWDDPFVLWLQSH